MPWNFSTALVLPLVQSLVSRKKAADQQRILIQQPKTTLNNMLLF